MPSIRQTLLASALAAIVHGQGVIVKAQGAKGPASVGLLGNYSPCMPSG